MMKKTLCYIFLLVLLLASFSSCDVDPYKGKRPIDYPDSTWVCQNYSASFQVDADGNLKDSSIIVNGKETTFSFLWSALDETASLQLNWGDQLYNLKGTCKFKPSSFVISIDDTEGLFAEKSIILEFKRNE